jgi:hypothetical protein
MGMIVVNRSNLYNTAISESPTGDFRDNYNKDSYLNEADMNS